MNTAKMILDKLGLHPPSTAPGRYYTTCPKCSAARKKRIKNSNVSASRSTKRV